VIGTCIAAAFTNILWFEMNDTIRQHGYPYLPAGALFNINSMVMATVLGLLLALTLDSLIQ